MTAVEFAKAMDYDYSTVMRWLKDGIVPGAEFVPISGQFGVWQIPKSALTEIKLPRPGRKRRPKKVEVKKAEASAQTSLFEQPETAAKPKTRTKKTGVKKAAKKKGGAAK